MGDSRFAPPVETRGRSLSSMISKALALLILVVVFVVDSDARDPKKREAEPTKVYGHYFGDDRRSRYGKWGIKKREAEPTAVADADAQGWNYAPPPPKRTATATAITAKPPIKWGPGYYPDGCCGGVSYVRPKGRKKREAKPTKVYGHYFGDIPYDKYGSRYGKWGIKKREAEPTAVADADAQGWNYAPPPPKRTATATATATPIKTHPQGGPGYFPYLANPCSSYKCWF